MSKNLLFIAFLLACLQADGFSENQKPSQQNSEFEDTQGDIKWHGPGVYYGNWFESKESYDEWLKQEHSSKQFEEGDGSHDQSNGLHGGDDYADYGTDYGPP